MARTRTPPIPANMYRHFAILTIALTASVALFADGESRNAVTQRVADHRREVQDRPGKHLVAKAPTLAGTPRPPADDSDAFGTPSAGRFANRASSATAFDDLIAAGYAREYLESLTPEDRQHLLVGVRRAGAAVPEHAAEAAALGAASAARSGATGRSD